MTVKLFLLSENVKHPSYQQVRWAYSDNDIERLKSIPRLEKGTRCFIFFSHVSRISSNGLQEDALMEIVNAVGGFENVALVGVSIPGSSPLPKEFEFDTWTQRNKFRVFDLKLLLPVNNELSNMYTWDHQANAKTLASMQEFAGLELKKSAASSVAVNDDISLQVASDSLKKYATAYKADLGVINHPQARVIASHVDELIATLDQNGENVRTKINNFSQKFAQHRHAFNSFKEPGLNKFIKQVLTVLGTVLLSIPTLGAVAACMALYGHNKKNDALHFWRREPTKTQKFLNETDILLANVGKRI